MKTTKIFKTGIAMLMVAGLFINTYASGDPTSNTEEKSSELSMIFTVPTNMNTNISIFDQAGSLVTANYFIKNNVGKSYDFSKVDKGTYTFVIETEFKSVEKTISVDNKEIRVLNEVTEYRPIFTIDDDILTISYINLDEENISIELSDETYLYMEEKDGNDMAYGKMLDLKNLPKGEFTVALKAGYDMYKYNFNR